MTTDYYPEYDPKTSAGDEGINTLASMLWEIIRTLEQTNKKLDKLIEYQYCE